MTGYTKLFGSIVASTIWREPHQVRIVWITMLALANKYGIVEASAPGLADLSRVTVDECREALSILSTPDPDSRTKEYEGRRIKEVDGGWLLLNHAKYRSKMNTDERREYLRIKQKEHRERSRQQPVNKRSDSSTVSTHAEAEAKAEAPVAKKNLNTKVSGLQPDVVEGKKKKVAKVAGNGHVKEILDYLNLKSNRNFRHVEANTTIINARLKEDGVTVEGVKAMIDRQVTKWSGGDMEDYLRPETLFRKSKFDGYYASKDAPIPPAKTGDYKAKKMALLDIISRHKCNPDSTASDPDGATKEQREEYRGLKKELAEVNQILAYL